MDTSRLNVHGVGGDFTSDDEREVLTVYTDAVHSIKTGPIYAEMTLPERKQVKFQIDRGATASNLQHINKKSGPTYVGRSGTNFLSPMTLHVRDVKRL